MQLKFPDSMTTSEFLREYWQRKPLLMRRALPGLSSPLPPDELAGMACEEGIESRIVIEHSRTRWEMRHGPFSEDTFADLPQEYWTLLVQDVDKYVPEVRELLAGFRFIPDWRVDDIMISYAENGGSVGPHTDTYDVFLIQAEGNRRWKINTGNFNNAELLDDLPVRILRDFSAEQEWLLEPGDILYLPPGVAHWGVAEGECITLSVGFRAPSEQEMLAAFSHYLLDKVPQQPHYLDPALEIQTHSAEILPAAFQQAKQILDRWHTDEQLQKRWYGCFVTETKEHLVIEPPADKLTPEVLRSSLQQQQVLFRHPFARFAFTDLTESSTALFACGESFELAARYRPLLELLTSQQSLDYSQIDDWCSDSISLDLLTTLYNRGIFELDDN